MAIDAAKFSDDVVDFHSLDKGGDALEITMASSNDLEVNDGIVFVDDAHLPGANVLWGEGEGLLHGLPLLVDDDAVNFVAASA